MGGVLNRLGHPFERPELARCESAAAADPGAVAAAAAAKPGAISAKPGAIAVNEAAAPTTTPSSCSSDPNARLVRGPPSERKWGLSCSMLRRGCQVDSPRGRAAAAPRLPRG